jgi:hypothetical protein
MVFESNSKYGLHCVMVFTGKRRERTVCGLP